MHVCPTGAISEVEHPIGQISADHHEATSLVYGTLALKETMAPPLIQQVRAEQRVDKINIIDAPPGTACSLMSAISHVDYIILVTEPTPFGLNDLKLAVEAVRLFDTPMGIVINRSDIGDNKVLEYAGKEKIPVLLEIPFSMDIARAYSCGKPIVDILPSWKEKFQGVFDQIKQQLEQERE